MLSVRAQHLCIGVVFVTPMFILFTFRRGESSEARAPGARGARNKRKDKADAAPLSSSSSATPRGGVGAQTKSKGEVVLTPQGKLKQWVWHAEEFRFPIANASVRSSCTPRKLSIRFRDESALCLVTDFFVLIRLACLLARCRSRAYPSCCRA